MRKKLIGLIMTILCVCGIVTSVSAKTRDEAVAWVKAQVGTTYDVDGIYGYQCSDFASAYLNWLNTGNPKSGTFRTWDGKGYFDAVNYYPAGYTRIVNTADFVPEPGDILCFGAGTKNESGHVAIAIEGCTTSILKAVDQDGYRQGPAQYSTLQYFSAWYNFQGVIRPKFDDTPAPTPTPTPKPVPPTNLSISVNYTIIPVGDAVTFNYSISGAASKNIGIDRNGGRFANIPVSADSGTAVYTFNEKGTYCCIIEGSNDGGSSHSDGVYINVVDRDYPITYNPNGGTGAPSNQTKTFWDTLTLSSDKPSRRGYVFKDWNTKQDGTGTVFNPGAEYKTNEAMTLYAQWTPAVPTVGDIADKTYLGTEITPDLEIKDGSEVLVKDTDYTLTYENNINAGTATVKVTYKGDYAESAAVERQFKILQADPVVKTNPKAKGVILNRSLSTSEIVSGIITGVDGITELTGAYSWENGDEIMNQKGKFKKILVYTPDDANYKSIKFELDILVYTNGRPAICRVTFDSKGGSAVPSQTVLSSATEPEQPVKEGYTFDGWYSDSSCTKAYDFSSKVAGNITLYAKWTQIENPVSEDKNNAEKDEKNNEIILTIGQKKATVFGKTKSNDVAPIVRNDRIMLPARFVAESLGADVSWDGVKKEVKITGKDKNNKSIVILIYIDSDTAYVNGKAVKLDSPAFVENDRTYTPIRFISENLGADVDWDGTKMQVIITK